MDQKTKSDSDEIDLAYFFKPVFRAFNHAIDQLNRIALFFKRNILLFLISFILLALFGYSLKFILPKYYKFEAKLVAYNLSADYYLSMLETISSLAGNDNNANEIASYLSIPSETARAIKSIDGNSLDSLYNIETSDTLLKAYPFSITLISKQAGEESKIQEGLISYFEKNEYSKKRKETKQKALTELRNNYQKRLLELDSLKEVVNTSIVPRSSGQGIILGQPISPVDIYNLEQNYYQQIVKLEQQLHLLRSVEIVQPFISRAIPNYPNYNLLFLYFLIAAFLVALLITILWGK